MTSADSVYGRKLAPWQCQRCGHDLRELANADTGKHTQPNEGDLALCPECGAIWIFVGHEMQVRRPTSGERAEILADEEVRARIYLIATGRHTAIARGRDELRRGR